MNVEIDAPVEYGYRVGGDPWHRRQELTVRCLAPSVYWIESAGAQATAVVGTAGVLVIDPYDGARTSAVVDAVRELWQAPITAVAYTHHHGDHIGGAQQLVERAERDGRGMRILATGACSDAIIRRGVCPPPTEVLDSEGSFAFENIRIDYGTLGGHSPDNTFFLVNGVLHCVDTLHPGQLEYEFFGIPSLIEYVDLLNRLRSLDWRVLNAGHADIGWPADVDVALSYLADLCGHVIEEAAKVPFDRFVVPGGNGYSWSIDRRKVVADSVLDRMRTRWGGQVGFDEYAWSHVWWAYHQVTLLQEPPYLG